MGRDHGGGARAGPKSYSAWLTATLLANGVPLPLPLDVAHHVAEILFATRRTVDPRRWVGRYVARAEEAEAAAMPHNLL